MDGTGKMDEIQGDIEVYCLRHIEDKSFICFKWEKQPGKEYLAAFTEAETCRRFREEIGLLEHVDVVVGKLSDLPFEHVWINDRPYQVKAPLGLG